MNKDRSKVIERIKDRTRPENRLFVRKNLEISQQISHILEEKNWDQKDLAEKLGKQESEVSKILSGLHNITLKTLSKIESVLDQEVITTPLEACKKYKSIEYVTFYVRPDLESEQPFSGTYIVAESSENEETPSKPPLVA